VEGVRAIQKDQCDRAPPTGLRFTYAGFTVARDGLSRRSFSEGGGPGTDSPRNRSSCFQFPAEATTFHRVGEFTPEQNMRHQQSRNTPCPDSKSRLEKNVKAAGAIILAMAVNTVSFVLAEAESPKVTGSWKVEITFANEQQRFLRFDALSDGKGTLTVADPQSKVWGGAKPSEGKWTRDEGNSVTFSGPVEFLIGNVGRDAGTLTLKGKFDTPDLITGEVEFSPLVGDGPSKHGTFKAVRVGGGD
jgi:hypothetical protein